MSSTPIGIGIREGLRMWRRARHVREHGFQKHKGTPEGICRTIIDGCFDKEKGYYRVSTGHFCEYYVRDFALCCEALVRLGKKEEVRKTLRYALARFEEHGSITTAINPDGVPFDYYLPSGPESVGLFLYSLTHTGNAALARRHKGFLQSQVDRVAGMMDNRTLLPRGAYSTIRDHAKRKASCYDMVMLCLVARESRRLGLRFPHTERQLREKLISEYWNGTYFFQDITKQPIVISDANIFPFWAGIITDKAALGQAMTAIRAARLDEPFPIRYVSRLDKHHERTAFHFASLLAPDYETDSIWPHLGLAYIRVLREHDPRAAAKHLDSYRRLIMRHRNFLEVYGDDGFPLRRAFYITDESMLWCADWLVLVDAFKSNKITTK